MQIWEYTLRGEAGVQEIVVPEGARFLTVLSRYDCPVLYFMVNPTGYRAKLQVSAVGTGELLADDLAYAARYLGSVVCHGGLLIWHIFVDRDDAYGLMKWSA